MVVERRFVDRRGIGDLLHRDRCVAVRGEKRPRLAQDARATADIDGDCTRLGLSHAFLFAGERSIVLTAGGKRSIVRNSATNQPVSWW
jgi:hypothetical protein